MVVIAISAILAVVAVPAYKRYVIKSKVAEKVELAYALLGDITTVYSKIGSFPTSVEFAGTRVQNDGQWTAIATNPSGVVGFRYFTLNGNTGYMQITFTGLDGIPDYNPVSGHPNGEGHATLTIAARDDGTTVKYACGQDAYLNQDIPLEYLPSSCQCLSVGTFKEDGTGC